MEEHVDREARADPGVHVFGSTTLFAGKESHHVAVGIVAVGNEALPGLENEYDAYRRLRSNASAHSKQHFPGTTLSPEDAESDADDERSIHFGLYENSDSSVRAIGAMRLIIKTHGYCTPLPVERHHPEAFADAPSILPSAEVSLPICRHEDDRVQKHLAGILVLAGLSYALERGITAIFGAVEAALEFNTAEAPVRIDVVGLLHHIRAGSPDPIDLRHAPNPNFTYFDVSNEG